MKNICILIFLLTNSLLAYQQQQVPFQLKDLRVTKIDSKEDKLRIDFSTEMLTTGKVSVELLLPNSINILLGESQSSDELMQKGNTLTKVWFVDIPKSDYYLLTINLAFNQDSHKKTNKRKEILRIAEKYGASNVRVFGSVVRGEETENSDIDFLVELESGRSLFDHAGLIVDLEDLLEKKIDVVTEGGIKPRFRERIYNEAIAL